MTELHGTKMIYIFQHTLKLTLFSIKNLQRHRASNISSIWRWGSTHFVWEVTSSFCRVLSGDPLKIRPAHFKKLLLSSARVNAVQFHFEDGRLRGAEPFINYLFVNTFVCMLFQAIEQRGGDMSPTLASPGKISLECKCMFRYIIEICTVYIHIWEVK